MWELIYLILGSVGVLLCLWEFFDSHMPSKTDKTKFSEVEKRIGQLSPVKVKSEGPRFKK